MNQLFYYIIFFYIALILTIICIELLYKLKTNKNVKIANKDLTYKTIMEELSQIVQYKCTIAYRRALQPIVDKALNTTPLLNDKIVNELSIQITKEIFDEMSEGYLNKLYSIYKREKIEEIILELVYNTITEMALEINKTTIQKMNIQKSFKNITKGDID